MFDWLLGPWSDQSIPDWYVRERQLMAAQSGHLHALVEKNREHVAKALKLVEGCPPAFNIQPYIDIVAQADALGLDVVRRTPDSATDAQPVGGKDFSGLGELAYPQLRRSDRIEKTKRGRTMEKRIVTTVAIGDAAQEWADYSTPWMMDYASRCGADFLCITTGLDGLWPGYAKLKLGELLSQYDRLAFIDGDILVSPDAPNLFDLVPVEQVGATRIDHLSPEEAPAIKNGWVANDMKVIQDLLGHVNWTSCYYNSGSMVFSKQHKAIFDKALETVHQWAAITEDRSQPVHTMFADQTLFNYWTQALGFGVYDLGPAFNHTPAFNRRHHRYLSHFYHYVRLRPHRRGNRVRQMKIDSAILRQRWLHRFLRANPFFARVVDRL